MTQFFIAFLDFPPHILREKCFWPPPPSGHRWIWPKFLLYFWTSHHILREKNSAIGESDLNFFWNFWTSHHILRKNRDLHCPLFIEILNLELCMSIVLVNLNFFASLLAGLSFFWCLPSSSPTNVVKTHGFLTIYNRNYGDNHHWIWPLNGNSYSCPLIDQFQLQQVIINFLQQDGGPGAVSMENSKSHRF